MNLTTLTYIMLNLSMLKYRLAKVAHDTHHILIWSISISTAVLTLREGFSLGTRLSVRVPYSGVLIKDVAHNKLQFLNNSTMH